MTLPWRSNSPTAGSSRRAGETRSFDARPGSFTDPNTFSEQQRDLYIAAGDLGFWQAALRDPTVELYAAMSGAITSLGRVTIDLLYGDIEGGQSTITRFVLLPSEADKWRYDVTHHWRLADGN